VFQLELRIPPLALVGAHAVGIALVTVYVPLLVVPFAGHKYAAAALMLAGLLLALVLAFCWFLTRFQIIPEERALLAAFGQEFAQYMARVRRWI